MPHQATYFHQSGDGHHGDYDRLFAAIASDIGVEWTVTSDLDKVNASFPLFYPMFDTKPGETLRAAGNLAQRALRGRKTVGLFFRPGDCFARVSAKSLLRRGVFTALSRLPHASLLSIVPFFLAPAFAQVATDWIYDPQLWDIPYLGMPAFHEATAFDENLAKAAQGRKIIVALGRQDFSKGFDHFADIWNGSAKIRDTFLFVSAGKIHAPSKPRAAAFAENGGFLIDARVEDALLFHLYRRASAVWVCYAPSYDQSSGIHGRAVQLGVPVLVRQGSLVEGLGSHLDHPTLAIPFDDVEASAQALLNWTPQRVPEAKSKATIEAMRNHSLKVLKSSLS